MRQRAIELAVAGGRVRPRCAGGRRAPTQGGAGSRVFQPAARRADAGQPDPRTDRLGERPSHASLGLDAGPAWPRHRGDVVPSFKRYGGPSCARAKALSGRQLHNASLSAGDTAECRLWVLMRSRLFRPNVSFGLLRTCRQADGRVVSIGSILITSCNCGLWRQPGSCQCLTQARLVFGPPPGKSSIGVSRDRQIWP